MVPTYHYIVPPNASWKKKSTQRKEPWQYLDHLESL